MFAEFNRTKVTLIHSYINTYIHTDEANLKRVKRSKNVSQLAKFHRLVNLYIVTRYPLARIAFLALGINFRRGEHSLSSM